MDNDAKRARNNEYCRRYRANNKEKRRATNKAYREKNREQAKEYHRKWRLTHPGYLSPCRMDPAKLKEIRKRGRNNFRSKPGGKLTQAVSFAVYRSLKSGAKAGRRWESIMGYTLAQLMRHLEKQFTPEMSWSNYGTYWHVDHKIPISAFNFERPEDLDFKRCWALKNLQPLEGITNIRKGAKLGASFQPSLTI